MFTTPVLNAKAAQKHLLKVKQQHADLVSSIQNHSLRVEQYNQMKADKLAFETNEKNKLQTEKMKFDQQSEKDRMEMENKRNEFAHKREELELKKKALSSD